jgi:serine/threonine protein kinase
MQAVDFSLPIGTVLGDFKVLNILGVGGFGITYKAQDTRLGRLVAIKEFLPVELAARGSDSKSVMPRTNVVEDYQYGLKKFLDEAKTLASFNHPNIVKIHTFLELNGTAYLVMEYVEGEALDEHLKKIHFNGNMSESRIREIIEPLLKGLAQVHKAGLLHRDIKPGNIYLQNANDASNEHGNNPMLIDFGAARQSVGEKSKSISAIVSDGYAPPEQYNTHSAQGPHTDIYAIGAVMYYLVSGVKPIGSTHRQHQILDDEDDPLTPLEVNQQYSQVLINLINECLTLKAKARPQSVAAVVKLLHAQKSTEAPLKTSEAKGIVDDDATRKIIKTNVVPSNKATNEVVNPGQTKQQTSNQVSDNPSHKKRNSLLALAAIFLMVFLSQYDYFQRQYQHYQVAKEQRAFYKSLNINASDDNEFPTWLSHYDENCSTDSTECYATIMDIDPNASWQKNLAVCAFEVITEASLLTSSRVQGLDKSYVGLNDDGQNEDTLSHVSKITSEEKHGDLSIQTLVKNYYQATTINDKASYSTNSSQVTKITPRKSLAPFIFKSYAQLTTMPDSDDGFDHSVTFIDDISTAQLTSLFEYFSQEELNIKQTSTISEIDNKAKYLACQISRPLDVR